MSHVLVPVTGVQELVVARALVASPCDRHQRRHQLDPRQTPPLPLSPRHKRSPAPPAGQPGATVGTQGALPGRGHSTAPALGQGLGGTLGLRQPPPGAVAWPRQLHHHPHRGQEESRREESLRAVWSRSVRQHRVRGVYVVGCGLFILHSLSRGLSYCIPSIS